MNEIKYEIKKIADKIYSVVVPDFYDRVMLFLRPQEFYEGTNTKFRNKDFCIFDFMKWYSAQEYRNGAFTYADDWGGFNIPFDIALKCYKNSPMQTPYDITFSLYILGTIDEVGSYIIGTDGTDKELFDHELAHALFYTNKEYKKEMLALVNKLPENIKNDINLHLNEMGYTKKVYKDEIQAYLSSYCLSSNYFNRISKVELKKYKKTFSEILKKYKSICIF